MSDMNRKLLEMYSKILDNDIWSRLSKEQDLAGPLLIDVPDAYHEAKVKLLVVGQQTDGWGHPEDGIEGLLAEYRRFEMGKGMRSPYSSPFSKRFHRLLSWTIPWALSSFTCRSMKLSAPSRVSVIHPL